MNIKKYTLRSMCTVLACSTFMSGLLAVHATEAIITETPMDETSGTNDSNWTTEENSFEDIQVTYTQSSSYFVTIPKTVALDAKKQAAYSVKVAGEIGTNQRVYVAPVDGIADTESLDFYMKHQAADNVKADVAATVTQNKIYWNFEEVAAGYEETNNNISAPDLTSGTWKGTFQMEIRLETNGSHTHNYVDGVCTECGANDPSTGHEHNYVDGKCECGVVDPNHTHNYEGGTCTICGKEIDPYEVAPENAYSNWDYTLNDDESVIMLNCYTGSETDVIVYANYVIDGKTYRTQIASNADSATYQTPYMFNGNAQTKCKNIETIKFSDNIDTSNVTNMGYMFYNCTSLINLDISAFDTSKVTNVTSMFSYCTSLNSIDLSNFDTGNVTNMCGLFSFCTSLTDLDLSRFDTKNVMDMSYLVSNCKSLTSVDLSNFDTRNVEKMNSAFAYCASLINLDLSSFDTSKATNMNSMFYSCSNLKNIYVTRNKWSTSQASTISMFDSCGTSEVIYQ